MIRHVLVAVDGSEPSRRAARFAHDLAEQTASRLTVLLVLEPPPALPIGPLNSTLIAGRPWSEEDVARAYRLLEEITADLPRAQADKLVEIGLAADTICKAGERLAVDVIVVGARGLTTGGRWLLGSVSERVVHHAGRPVTVVH